VRTVTYRYREIRIKLLPKNFKCSEKLRNRSRALLESIDLDLQLGDSNKITMREPFLKLVPHIQRIVEIDDALSD
jgi:hypothetical protein